jgi:molybdate transport system substrate-binding protein
MDLNIKSCPVTGLWKRLLLGFAALIFSFSAANAAANCTNVTNPDITIAVASNLWIPAQSLVGNYTNANIQVCHDSTGNLVNEINAGNSNYSLFLAANHTAPYDVPDYSVGSVSNYTTGIPALWSNRTDSTLLTKNSSGVFNGSINLANIPASGYVVIANQATAPYGAKAEEIMRNATGQWNNITGENYLKIESNIDNTYNYIGANNDSVGYVALSQICLNGTIKEGSAYYNYKQDYNIANIPQAGVVIHQNATGKDGNATQFFSWLLAPYAEVSNNAQYILQHTYCYGAPQ